MELLNYDDPPEEVRSEQPIVHSAPFPWRLLFELNKTVNLLAREMMFFGPLFWQNLRNRPDSVFTRYICRAYHLNFDCFFCSTLK